MNIWQRWKRTAIHNKALVVTSILVAFATLFYSGAAIFQVIIMNKSARDASVQGDKLIIQAEKSATASRDFADAAQLQAQKMKTLADNSGLQASIARKALATTIESANLDRRPWIGIVDYRCNGCSEADGTIKIGEFYAVMANTGKTPAIDMNLRIGFSLRTGKDSPPDVSHEIDVMEHRMAQIDPHIPPQFVAENTLRRKEMFAKEVLAPNATRSITLVGQNTFPRGSYRNFEKTQILYSFGRITYYSGRRDKKYTTTYCLMSEHSVDWHFCPSGNDMN
jgi:hypothetical protein